MRDENQLTPRERACVDSANRMLLLVRHRRLRWWQLRMIQQVHACHRKLDRLKIPKRDDGGQLDLLDRLNLLEDRLTAAQKFIGPYKGEPAFTKDDLPE
jgi:hypothetical protein